MESGAVFQAPLTSPTLPVGVYERSAVLNEEAEEGPGTGVGGLQLRMERQHKSNETLVLMVQSILERHEKNSKRRHF